MNATEYANQLFFKTNNSVFIVKSLPVKSLPDDKSVSAIFKKSRFSEKYFN